MGIFSMYPYYLCFLWPKSYQNAPLLSDDNFNDDCNPENFLVSLSTEPQEVKDEFGDTKSSLNESDTISDENKFLNQIESGHEGDKPFKCKLCDVMFTRISSLKARLYMISWLLWSI